MQMLHKACEECHIAKGLLTCIGIATTLVRHRDYLMRHRQQLLAHTLAPSHALTALLV